MMVQKGEWGHTYECPEKADGRQQKLTGKSVCCRAPSSEQRPNTELGVR
jgi:hypothetical protein